MKGWIGVLAIAIAAAAFMFMIVLGIMPSVQAMKAPSMVAPIQALALICGRRRRSTAHWP